MRAACTSVGPMGSPAACAASLAAPIQYPSLLQANRYAGQHRARLLCHGGGGFELRLYLSHTCGIVDNLYFHRQLV